MKRIETSTPGRWKQFARMLLVVASVAGVSACGGSPGSPAAANSVSIEVQPPSAESFPLGSTTFAAAVTGSVNTAVTWSITEASGGTVDAGGNYVAPQAVGTYHVVARSVADPTVSGSASIVVTVAPTLAVTISPRSATVYAGQTVTFAASVTGTSNTGVNWAVQEASGCGSITPAGLYTSPGSATTCHVVATSQADSTRTDAVPVTVQAALPTNPSTRLGINLYDVSDWAYQFTFANVAMEGRVGPDGSGPFDAQRWPTGSTIEIAGDSVGKPGSAGRYAFRFQGKANVSDSGGGLTINYTYNSSASSPDFGWTTGTIDKPSASSQLYITLSNAQRFANGALQAVGTGVTRIEILRPGQARGDAFSQALLDRVSHFGAIRLMQFMGGPGPCPQQGASDVAWSDRVAPGAGTRRDSGPWGTQYTYKSPPYDCYAGKGPGPSIEWAIALANAANKDLWINVPFYANDAYVQKFAQAIKFGTDGVNPYTSTQANPAWPPLNPGLKVYVEYFNEIWNYKESENSSLAGSAASAFHFNSQYGGYDRLGFMAVRNSLVFRTVFGDAEMMTRVRPVLAGQMANLGHVQDGVSYIQRVWGPANAYGYPAGASAAFSITNPGASYGSSGHTIDWYIYAISGAPYIDLGSGSDTIAQLQDYLNRNVKGWFDAHDKYATTLGIKVACYEGGFEIPADSATTAALSDPRVTALLVDYLGYFFAKPSSDVFMYYTLVSRLGREQYGLSADTTSEATPAWNAVLQVIAAGH
jgi:hypothetical protein